jgi:SAM-dependent methyltransferase
MAKYNNLPPKELFTNYYHENFWANPETVSGGGSTLAYTENIRKELPKLITQFKIVKFLDAPCGDFHWFKEIEMPGEVEYIGGDIVDELVRQNQTRHGDQHTTFISLDIINDTLPQADLWMCRDCLFHFSYDDIFKTLNNFLRSDIKYIFTSVHTNCTKNLDIVTGGARLLNLELPPFNLCKPILYVEDSAPDTTVGRMKKMGLWTRSMIADSLDPNPRRVK